MLKKRVLFIHHSTGGNLIKEGNLRQEINKLNPKIEFWDHNYNLSPIFTDLIAMHTHLKGLVDAEGNITGQDYNIILSNNSPREYADIFSRKAEDSTLRKILTYDIIAFKNCYPTTRISSDNQLQDNINYYKKIRDSIKKYPDKTFVLLTPPPARKETTSIKKAQRAKQLVAWLNSKEFSENLKNIRVFDFFSLLADENGFLKEKYQRFLPWDSHPNKKANQEIAPVLAKFIVKITDK